jgi:hypothetical protein
MCEADKLLFTFGRCTDNDQQALGLFLEASLDMDAVDPKVNIAFGRQIPPRSLCRSITFSMECCFGPGGDRFVSRGVRQFARE